MSIATQLQELHQIKQDIKNSLINKNINMSNVAFNQYAEKIDSITQIYFSENDSTATSVVGSYE